MAENKKDYQFISVDSDDADEVVFHAGVRTPSGPSPDSEPVSESSSTASQEASGSSVGRVGETRDVPASASDDGDASDGRQAPRTAQERQAERKRAEQRQLAAEIAATEDDLKRAGKMSAAQVVTIVVCIVLLVVGAIYIANTFLA